MRKLRRRFLLTEKAEKETTPSIPNSEYFLAMPKLFRNSTKETSGPGWSAYMPVDYEESDVEFDDFVFTKKSKKDRAFQTLIHKLNTMWFRYLVRSFSRAIYEIDNLEAGSFDEERRLQPRARLLLRENYISIQFGIYLIEYTIENNVAYSQFSVNYGLTYIIHMELHLGDNAEENLVGLVDMFRYTENHLHSTLINRQPPYLPNYIRR